MANLVMPSTAYRVSNYAKQLKRRQNGENIVRLTLVCVAIGFLILIHQRENTLDIMDAEGRQSGRTCRA